MTLEGVTVRDSFGEMWNLETPSASGASAWSLFHSAGLPESQLLVWPVAVAPHAGPVLDEILIGVDEDANLAWAVELRADGMQMLRDAETAAAIAETTRTGTRDVPLSAVDDAAERMASVRARARRRSAADRRPRRRCERIRARAMAARAAGARACSPISPVRIRVRVQVRCRD